MLDSCLSDYKRAVIIASRPSCFTTTAVIASIQEAYSTFPPLREWGEQVVATTAHAVDMKQAKTTGVYMFRRFCDQASGTEETYRSPEDVVRQELCEYISDLRVLKQQSDSELPEPETQIRRNPDAGLKLCDLQRRNCMHNASRVRSQITKLNEAERRVRSATRA